MASSSSRTPYRAEHTPDQVDFPNRDAAFKNLSACPSPSSTSTVEPGTSGHEDRQESWRSVVHKARAVARNNTGLLLVGAAQFFFALMNVWVKKLNSLAAVPALELICVRMGITWICCVAYMYINKIADPILGPKEVRRLLVLRGGFGFCGIFSLYYSLQYLSLSDATVLQFLAPVFTAITGAVILHEPFSWREAAAGLSSLVGVVLIARPQFLFGEQDYVDVPGSDVGGAAGFEGRMVVPGGDGTIVTPAQRLLAVCGAKLLTPLSPDSDSVALLGTLGATGAYTTIRAIGKRAHALHNLVSYSSQSVLVATVAMLALRVPVVIPTQWEWLAMLLLIGIFGFTAQFLLTAGLQRENIVFAAADELIFFHTTPSLLSVIGTVIILGSAIYVAVSG
ncbi:DUF6-domain-containing protein [Trametes maxima]|nr:DUF6-domain-containing protein [Trametes maxima]